MLAISAAVSAASASLARRLAEQRARAIIQLGDSIEASARRMRAAAAQRAAAAAEQRVEHDAERTALLASGHNPYAVWRQRELTESRRVALVAASRRRSTAVAAEEARVRGVLAREGVTRAAGAGSEGPLHRRRSCSSVPAQLPPRPTELQAPPPTLSAEEGRRSLRAPCAPAPPPAPLRPLTVYGQRLRARARDQGRVAARLDATAGWDPLTGALPRGAHDDGRPAFVAHPPLVEFPGAALAMPPSTAPPRTAVVRLTNVSGALCGAKLLPPPARLRGALTWGCARQPGRVCPGGTIDVVLTLTREWGARAAASAPAGAGSCDAPSGPAAGLAAELVVVPECGPLVRVPIVVAAHAAQPVVSQTLSPGAEPAGCALSGGARGAPACRWR